MIKLHAKLFGAVRAVSDRAFIRGAYFLSFGSLPNLQNPQTFNEHICAIKCDDASLALAPYADKAAVRDYVRRAVGEKYLIAALGVYDAPQQIPYDTLPARFVIKCTHASGYNILVKDKRKLDIPEANRRLTRWLSRNYYTVGREKNYKEIPPRLLVETYLDASETLPEYKIFCFHGKPKIIDVNCTKKGKRMTSLYDTDWNFVPVRLGYPNAGDAFAPPKALAELLELAQTLAAPFAFVRVDLYAAKEGIFFSELTFTSGGGLVPFDPPEYDARFGAFFEETQ
jgi:hypothetical protein